MKVTKVTALEKARILSEALPHMQRYDNETVVVKYGGHAMGEEELARAFARDIVLLEQAAINPVVVHGGGPQIQAMLTRLGIKSEFAAGLRITDAATIEVVEMVLAGSINKQIVAYINQAGGCAVGLCGKDGNLVLARKATRKIVDPGSDIETIVDLGFVGEPEKVDVRVLHQIIGRELIPVLAPVAASADGGTFNVNADKAPRQQELSVYLNPANPLDPANPPAPISAPIVYNQFRSERRTSVDAVTGEAPFIT